MEIDVITAKKHLRDTRAPVHELRVTSAPGVYALFLKDLSSLKPFEPGRDGLIYVGRSSDLAQRDLKIHFDSEKTGFSTLRRSLGAILKRCLNLSAVPRSSEPSESNVRCYRFVRDGEDSLTEWMRRNLEVSVFIVGNPRPLEADLISCIQPLLNLKGWHNPYRQEIKALRKICADEARSHRSKRAALRSARLRRGSLGLQGGA